MTRGVGERGVWVVGTFVGGGGKVLGRWGWRTRGGSFLTALCYLAGHTVGSVRHPCRVYDPVVLYGTLVHAMA